MTLQELEPRAQVLELARLVSPAVRVEPDRLRAVRLAFLPRSQASLEADLWFSPLVQARNAAGLVLRPDVIVLLREELVGAARVPELRAVHETFQRALPPLLAIEEEIVWLALAGAEDGVAGHLLSVLKTMMSHPERAQGLASWAARALGELPAAVRNTPAAIHLDVATCARLRRPIRVEALRAGPSPLALPDLLPPDLPSVQVAVERRGDQLVFEIPAEPRKGAQILDVPATDPVILLITSGGATDVVTVQPGVRSLARVRGDTVTLRTLRGDEWELARHPVEICEAGLDLYAALLRGEHVPRARDRATAELLASGLAIETVGETGTAELRVRNRIIRQVYDQRWIDRSLPAQPARWVLVAGGTGAHLGPAVRDTSQRLGEELARRRIGLITREYDGVYQLCGTRYAEACYAMGLSPQRRIRCVTLKEEGFHDTGTAFPAEIRRVHSPRTEAVDIADAVVVLSGARRTNEVFEHASQTRKPILAAGALGGSAIEHFHRVIRTFQRGAVVEFNKSVAAIPLADYERLNAPGEAAVVETILHLLDLLFARP